MEFATKRVLCAAFALFLLVGTQPATAGTIDFGSLQFVIANGNSVTLGDKVFSNFAFASSLRTTGGATASIPTAATIQVHGTISGLNYTLSFDGFSYSAATTATGQLAQSDFTMTFDVKVTDPNFVIDSVDLGMKGSVSGLGHALIDETAVSGPNAYGMHVDAGSQTDATPIDPTNFAVIIKDANVLAVGTAAHPNSNATITEFSQSFHQLDKRRGGSIPETASLMMWGLGMASMVGLMRGKRR